LLFQVLINESDEVLIPSPYWVSYPDQVKIAGGKPVFVEGHETNDFKVTAKQLEEKITDRTKVLVLNSPSNPTGMMYTKEELTAIAAVCVKHDITAVSDEIYEKLIYVDQAHHSIASISEEIKSQTVI